MWIHEKRFERERWKRQSNVSHESFFDVHTSCELWDLNENLNIKALLYKIIYIICKAINENIFVKKARYVCIYVNRW